MTKKEYYSEKVYIPKYRYPIKNIRKTFIFDNIDNSLKIGEIYVRNKTL